MSKVRIIINSMGETQYLYHCLGCGYEHAFSKKIHQFNDDLNFPSVFPSLVQGWIPGKICHSFIRHGQIEYLSDCWHHLKGKTIQLPEIDPATGKLVTGN